MKIRTFLAAILTMVPCVGQPAITLKVLNEARLDDQILSRTKNGTAAMLARAGVSLVWFDCAAGVGDWKSQDPCQHDGGRVDFRLHVTTYKPPLTTRDMLGYADVGGAAGVYYPLVAELARDCHVDPAQILAAAIVHEVGHLILGANAHTQQGIMRADWGKEQFTLISAGELNFAPDQARRLQIELRRRLSEGKQRPQADELTLTVCTEGLAGFHAAAPALPIAASMFAAAGIRVAWRTSSKVAPRRAFSSRSGSARLRIFILALLPTLCLMRVHTSGFSTTASRPAGLH
jgi:hypothetical protein